MSVPGPLVVSPVFKERLWGGTTLRQWFGDAVPDGVIGECWAISGLPGDCGTVVDGPGAGLTLDAAWRSGVITGHQRDDDFPLLVKLLDPADWLSVQVHPDDEQAQRMEGQPRGKAECWYVVDCRPGAELIIGHNAATAAELRAELDDGTIDSHLERQAVQPGSFFMVPAGCVHAIGPGMLIYEVQQSSDLTYRLYDFDRVGLDGRPRQLHIDRGYAVVTAPFDPAASLTAGEPVAGDGAVVRDLVDGEHFAVREVRVQREHPVGSAEDFELLTVLEGSATLDCAAGPLPLARGTSLVLPAGCRGTVRGDVLLITTRPGPAITRAGLGT